MKRFYAVAAGLLAGALAAGAGVYDIDVSHTSIGFSVSHMVLAKVKGSFNDFSGTAEFDGQDPMSLRVQGTIKVASINTGIANRDNHLRSGDFFDAEAYPEILFETVSVAKSGDGYVLTGKLTMRGVTKEISGPVIVKGPIKDPWGKSRIGLEATTQVNRQDFGVKWSQKMDGGGLVVGDEVSVEINAEAVLREPAAEPGSDS